MKGLLLILLMMGMAVLSAVSIFDIQYTTDPGSDNTYPSRYAGKSVSVEGIVTSTNFRNGGFFLSEPSGGPWRSILVRTANRNVNRGDRIILRGIVDEYFGMTCLREVKAIRRLGVNYPVPPASQVTSGQITTADQAEAYESALVKIQNATVRQNPGSNSKIYVNDGSGSCLLGSLISADGRKKYKSGVQFVSVTGIVCYSFGEYSINPRNDLDTVIFVPVLNQNRSWGRIKSIYK